MGGEKSKEVVVSYVRRRRKPILCLMKVVVRVVAITTGTTGTGWGEERDAPISTRQGYGSIGDREVKSRKRARGMLRKHTFILYEQS